jgi:hypothetical protein
MSFIFFYIYINNMIAAEANYSSLDVILYGWLGSFFEGGSWYFCRCAVVSISRGR